MSEVKKSGEHGGSAAVRAGSVWASVGFWLTVFAATSLLASVVLAPRLERIATLQDELADLTTACVRLDRQNERLAQFLRALEHDPALVEQLADWELKGRPPEQMPALLTEHGPARDRTIARGASWWRRVVHLLANDPAVEQAAYFAVAGLYLIALTFFRVPASPSDTEGEEPETEENERGAATDDSACDIDPNGASDDEWLFCG